MPYVGYGYFFNNTEFSYRVFPQYCQMRENFNMLLK